MNDALGPHTEDQLRRALGERAQETTVSPDALDNIRNRRPSNAWGRPAVYAAVAAALTLLVGVAVWNIAGDDDPVDVANDPPTTTTASTPTTTVGSEEPPSTAPPAPERFTGALPASPVAYAEAGAILWPTSGPGWASGQEAALWWANEGLGVASPNIQAVSGEALGIEPSDDVEVFDLRGVGEDGLPADFAVTKIITASRDGGETWVVTHSGSEEFQVTLVEQNTPDTIRVTGTGRAFEGQATIQIGDAEPTLLSVGGVDQQPFSIVVPAPESYPTPIAIRDSVVVDNEIPQTHAFAAVPIPRQTNISVFGVAADDTLNVRSGAGVSNDIVGTLAADATGIVHIGGINGIDGDTWWEVGDGTVTGWVNRAFLNVLPSASTYDDLLGNPVRQLGGDAPESGAKIADFAPRVRIGGIGVYADAATPWTAVNRADLSETPIDFCPEGLDEFRDDCVITVPDFLGVDTAKWDLSMWGTVPEIEEENFLFQTGLEAEFYERYLTSTIFIPEPDPDNSLDWRRYTIVWGAENGALRVEGIWRWGWTP